MVVVLSLSLFSFSPSDPSFNNETNADAVNQAGLTGAYLSDFLYQLFGYGSWLLAVLLLALAIRIAFDRRPYPGGWTAFFWLPLLLAISALVHAHGSWLTLWWGKLPAGAGGALGSMLADGLRGPLHAIGRDVVLLVLASSSFVAASHISVLMLTRRLFGLVAAVTSRVTGMTSRFRSIAADRRDRLQGRERRQKAKKARPKHIGKTEPTIAKPAKMKVSRRAMQDQQAELALQAPSATGFRLPALSLFSSGKEKRKEHSPESLQAVARMLEKKLLDYRVEGEVVAVQPGPVVTQFEFEPVPGTKASRIAALQDDLARAMSAVSVRIAGNIPGKSVIGIEIPNEERETVLMQQVLASKEFSDKRHILPLALGVDIAGAAVVTDLAKMPHLLIAGTTGSGKSVSVNTMICSMLMTYTPADLRLIMVDPKMLELSMYEDIPHLLVPVVTNPRKAAKALAWAVYEMERRYQLMADTKVRNIDSYNRSVQKKSPRSDEAAPERLPYIVIVIDELADLMMVAGKEVEQSICRLAQKARAAGIHLILATQRPSVDVITGLIKANLPSRISFQVSSKVDSRTILDQVGAEHLLGQGDSLLLSGGRDLKRVHGAFVSDTEVMELVEHLRAQAEPEYHEEVFEAPTSSEPSGNGDEHDHDDKYDAAVALVIEKGQCSVSMVQRYLRIGYNRASRIVEQMERDGIVTPPGSGGMRKVLARSEADGGGVIE
ncbi:MAG: DNA translocase FtsK [Mariprofundaceae bacterium]